VADHVTPAVRPRHSPCLRRSTDRLGSGPRRHLRASEVYSHNTTGVSGHAVRWRRRGFQATTTAPRSHTRVEEACAARACRTNRRASAWRIRSALTAFTWSYSIDISKLQSITLRIALHGQRTCSSPLEVKGQSAPRGPLRDPPKPRFERSVDSNAHDQRRRYCGPILSATRVPWCHGQSGSPAQAAWAPRSPTGLDRR
jgi:hypothetical protein